MPFPVSRLVLRLTLVVLTAATAFSQDEGGVCVLKGMTPAFDPYVSNPSEYEASWIREHFSRIIAYSPYFDSRTKWYPHAWAYIDAYAIYRQPSDGFPDIAAEHPDWILRDQQGQPLYIPWNCTPTQHACPQFAADFSNLSYQEWWIQYATATLARGAYIGLWIDDVNMDFRVSDGDGNFRNPVDRNTGELMTQENWRRYFADFLEKIRARFPRIEIVHNPIWYAGGSSAPTDPFLNREIASADWINIESGVNDTGLTGGDGPFSLSLLLAYIDHIHSLGKRVSIDNLAGGEANDERALEYTLANYFLISVGKDAVEDNAMVTWPGQWPLALSIDLGAATSPRTNWHGLLRRDFRNGLVLVNPPQAPTLTVPLPGRYLNTNRTLVTSVTLSAKQGVVLQQERLTGPRVLVHTLPDTSDSELDCERFAPDTQASGWKF